MYVYKASHASLSLICSWIFLTVIEELHRRAHEYANLANRASPIAKDLLLACDEYGIEPKDLQSVKDTPKEMEKCKCFVLHLHPFYFVDT